MKLSNDLIRDMLLFSESQPIEGVMQWDLILDSPTLSTYSKNEIIHAVSRMGNSGAQLISAKIQGNYTDPYFIFIGSPTFEGQKYLDNIRDPEVWKKTKKATSKFASVSIDILSSVASTVIQNMLFK